MDIDSIDIKIEIGTHTPHRARAYWCHTPHECTHIFSLDVVQLSESQPNVDNWTSGAFCAHYFWSRPHEPLFPSAFFHFHSRITDLQELILFLFGWATRVKTKEDKSETERKSEFGTRHLNWMKARNCSNWIKLIKSSVKIYLQHFQVTLIDGDSFCFFLSFYQFNWDFFLKFLLASNFYGN